MPRIILTSLILLGGSGGCAPWSSDLQEPSQLPLPRMSPDSVILEVAFVRPGLEDDIDQELWQQVDEQHLSTESRRRLAANGFRAGLVSSPLPAYLRQVLDEQQQVLDLHEQQDTSLDAGVTANQQRLQCRAGQPGKIVAGNNRDEMIVLLYQEGQVRGETYQQAQCVFHIKTLPQGDGRVRLELTPEVQHGQPRPRWVGHEGAFRLDADRQRKPFPDLRIEAVLAPGQTLLLGCTQQAKGLGQQFFTRSSAQPHPGLMLIRLAQTQLDDLFAPEKLRTPLATPAP